ncbi:hypothetical protein Tco_1302631 [Tanacetum coccineum]
MSSSKRLINIVDATVPCEERFPIKPTPVHPLHDTKENSESNIDPTLSFYNDYTTALLIQGTPFNLEIPSRYFFNKDLEYLIHGNTEKKYALSLTKYPAAIYNQYGIEEEINNIFKTSAAEYNEDADLGFIIGSSYKKAFTRQ